MWLNRLNKNSSKKEMEEHYDFFIKNVNYHLEIALQWLQKSKFDYSFEEIDEISRVYLTLYDKSKKPGQWYDEKYEVFVTYFGETFMKYFLGEWILNKMKRTFSEGFPIIIKHGPKDSYWIGIDPSDWLRSIEFNRNDEPLSKIFARNILSYKNKPEYNFDPLENLKKHL